MSLEDVKTFDRKRFPDAYSKVGLFGPDHHPFDGTWADEISRELLGRSNPVCVRPYKPIRNEAVLYNSFSSLPETNRSKIRSQNGE